MRVYIVDVLDLAGTSIAFLVGLTAYWRLPDDKRFLILVLGPAWILVVIPRVVLLARRRRLAESTKRQTIVQVFRWIYEQVFGNTPGRRLTLFMLDPLDENEIVPKVRYQPGSPQLRPERTSRARYRRGEGFTGEAWASTGDLIFRPLPRFATRQEFRTYYIDQLKIRPTVVDGLSDYMERVESIYSYGFCDQGGALLGVLSIDVQGTDLPLISGGDVRHMLALVGSLLEAFYRDRRRG